jgi:glucosamine-6-phosphate deaminase
MKIIKDTTEKVEAKLLEDLRQSLQDKPDLRIGLTVGSAQKRFFDLLCREHKKGNFSAAKAVAFAGEELQGTTLVQDYLQKNLLSEVPFAEVHFVPRNPATDKEASAYDEAIQAAGGLDWMLLGIGLDGRIALNEPATEFNTLTHIQKLFTRTREDLREILEFEGEVPEYGITMGIKTVIQARKIVMLAEGEEKADMVYKLVYGRTQSAVPADMLQIHTNFLLYLDTAAAAKLD